MFPLQIFNFESSYDTCYRGVFERGQGLFQCQGDEHSISKTLNLSLSFLRCS